MAFTRPEVSAMLYEAGIEGGCAGAAAREGSQWVDQSEAKQKEFRQHELAQHVMILRHAAVIRSDASLMAELREHVLQQRHDLGLLLDQIRE